MKISIDCGALCTTLHNRFGNYIFTRDLIRALSIYSGKNLYALYSFCSIPVELQYLPSKKNFSYKAIYPRKGWLNWRVSFEELLHRQDIFLGLNQAIPLYTSGKIICFSHGLAYYYFPKLYPDSYSQLMSQLKAMVNKSEQIIVSSSKVKDELLSIYPKLNNIKVLLYGAPFDMRKKVALNKARSSIRECLKKNYALYVGMDHKIKNVELLCKSFIKAKKRSDYLYLVGVSKEYEDKGSSIRVLQAVTRDELNLLYQHARILCTVSLYESFNLPVLEALSLKCPVVGLGSAIIPELGPFVEVCKKNELPRMIEIYLKRGPIKLTDRYTLLSTFSWKKYVYGLGQVYETEK